MGLNVVNLVGRAGAEPDIRFFESGNVVGNVSLAVDRPKRDSPPDWFRLEFWGRDAEIAKDYVRKGSLIGITGSLKIDTWQDRNTGMQRSNPVIRVSRLRLLGSKRDNNEAAMNSYQEF